ncbi:hypothetical protein REZ03_005381 [Klebsiella pneumoniae]|nr:hypothetical protein [Klebsiella pneumoniae]
MENKKNKVTKREVSISFFLFLVVFLLFLSFIPKLFDMNYLSESMAIGKILLGFVFIFLVAFNGANFVYRLLSYLEFVKNKEID